MFDSFITNGLEDTGDIADLGEMFDQDYIDEDIPDTFFLEYFPEGLSQNKDINIVPSNSEKNLSVVEMVTLSDDCREEYVIHCGPKQIDPPRIYIEPDYMPALTVLRWYMDQMNMSRPIKMPYVEVAQMTIPTQLKEAGPQVACLDRFMSTRGALICYPHHEFTTKASSDRYVVATDDFLMEGEINKKMAKYTYEFIFSPKYEFTQAIMSLGYKMSWLEFNPFNPLSPRYITNYKDDGKVIEGTYMWGRKERRFKFDRRDKKYRIHSDKWKYLVSDAYAYLSVFDIVANFDIAEVLPPIISSSKLYYRQGKMVEPFKVREGSYKYPYSPMMGERDNRGLWSNYNSTYHVPLQEKGENYYNVSSQCEMIRTAKMNEISIRIKISHREIGVVYIGRRAKIGEDWYINTD